MENEKIAALVLALMVAGILSAYLALENWDDISDNLTETIDPVDVVEYGDCVDLHYVLKYASNDTFIESSYDYWQNRSGGNLFKIFVSLNESDEAPSGYEMNYSQKMQDGQFVKGFIEGLVGLKEGETDTFTVEPEDAYGIRVTEGVNFSSIQVSPYLNQTFTVTNITDNKLTFKWIDLPEDNFTMPQGYLKENIVGMDFYYGSPYTNIPPYFLWEDSSKIVDTSSETINVLTTPDKSENLTEQPQMFAVGEKTSIILPDISTASWNDSKITISTNPELNYTYDITSQGQTLTLEVSNVTDNNFTLSYQTSQGSQSQVFNKTVVFDRVYNYKRIYSIPISINDANFGQSIPVALTFLESDFKEEGYSIHELAGKTLKYEVTIEEIYKTSQN